MDERYLWVIWDDIAAKVISGSDEKHPYDTKEDALEEGMEELKNILASDYIESTKRMGYGMQSVKEEIYCCVTDMDHHELMRRNFKGDSGKRNGESDLEGILPDDEDTEDYL